MLTFLKLANKQLLYILMVEKIKNGQINKCFILVAILISVSQPKQIFAVTTNQQVLAS